ncbi:biotin/lipoyl-binding protein, partial [Candidatus Igneacidithiobacillus taiwanensis]
MASKKKRVILLLLVLLIGAGLAYWWTHRPTTNPHTLTIYGNIDIREVQSAFNDSGRVQKLLVQEGDRVTRGQLLAELDPTRFQDAVDRDQATV